MNTAANIIPLDMPEPKRFSPPSLDEAKLHAAKIGLPMHEAEKFWCFYDSKDWHVGKNKMKRWHSSMALWKLNWGGTVKGITRSNNPSRADCIAYAKSCGDVSGFVLQFYERRQATNFANPQGLAWRELFNQEFANWRNKQTK